jgi:hypothetical protein
MKWNTAITKSIPLLLGIGLSLSACAGAPDYGPVAYGSYGGDGEPLYGSLGPDYGGWDGGFHGHFDHDRFHEHGFAGHDEHGDFGGHGFAGHGGDVGHASFGGHGFASHGGGPSDFGGHGFAGHGGGLGSFGGHGAGGHGGGGGHGRG